MSFATKFDNPEADTASINVDVEAGKIAGQILQSSRDYCGTTLLVEQVISAL